MDAKADRAFILYLCWTKIPRTRIIKSLPDLFLNIYSIHFWVQFSSEAFRWNKHSVTHPPRTIPSLSFPSVFEGTFITQIHLICLIIYFPLVVSTVIIPGCLSAWYCHKIYVMCDRPWNYQWNKSMTSLREIFDTVLTGNRRCSRFLSTGKHLSIRFPVMSEIPSFER